MADHPRGAPGCTCGTPPFAPPEPSGDCPFHGAGVPPVTDNTVRIFLDWMEGVFVGTPETMREGVKKAMTKALAGEECPYV